MRDLARFGLTATVGIIAGSALAVRNGICDAVGKRRRPAIYCAHVTRRRWRDADRAPKSATRQAIVSGEALRIPAYYVSTPEDRRPRSEGAQFSSAWLLDSSDVDLLEKGIRHWRAQIKVENIHATT